MTLHSLIHSVLTTAPVSLSLQLESLTFDLGTGCLSAALAGLLPPSLEARITSICHHAQLVFVLKRKILRHRKIDQLA